MNERKRMIADSKIRQDGVWLKPGDVFECTPGDAADLEAMGFAHRDTSDVPVRRQYRRRDMTAQ